MHITTSDTYFVDAIQMKGMKECPICGKMSHWEVGWLGWRHKCCKIEIDENDFMGSICRKRREMILKLSRKELGKILGYSTKTIKQYEWVKCSKKYADKLLQYVKNYILSGKK